MEILGLDKKSLASFFVHEWVPWGSVWGYPRVPKCIKMAINSKKIIILDFSFKTVLFSHRVRGWVNKLNYASFENHEGVPWGHYGGT